MKGQTLVEYALLLAFIVIVAVVAVAFVGPVVSGIFTDMAEGFQQSSPVTEAAPFTEPDPAPEATP